MPKGRECPCHPKLDAILEDYWSIEGASIKSILSVTAKGTTSPTALTRRDSGAETLGLLDGLTKGEIEELRSYYVWRQVASVVSRMATDARRETRNRVRRRAFKPGLKELERVWRENNTRPR